MDAEAKSDPMEGNMHRNVDLGSQNLQVPISLSKFTTEQFRECTECRTILLCLIALKIIRLVKKCIGHKMQIFPPQLLLQTFFAPIHI